MAQLDINHAAFTGFRLTRRYPMLIGVWSAILFAVMLAVGVVMANGDFDQIRAMYQPGGALDPAAVRPTDPEAARVKLEADLVQLSATWAILAPMLAVMVPLSLVFYGFFKAALYRGVLAPQQGGPGFLGFGAAEFRQVLVMLLIQCFLFVSIFLYLAATGVVVGVIGAFSQPVSALLVLAAMLGGVALLVKATVHLSMSGPATFSEGAVRVLRIWGLVKEKFWPVLGAYFLAGVLGVLVWLLGWSIQLGLMMAAGGAEAMSSLPASTADVFAPMSLLNIALSAVFSVMQLIIWLSPPAEIYRQLTDKAEDAF